MLFEGFLIMNNDKVVFPKGERVPMSKINSIKYLKQIVLFKQIFNAKITLG